MKYFVLIFCLLLVGCDTPPPTELKEKAKIGAKRTNQMEEFNKLSVLEKFQDEKFALFRSYGEVKAGYMLLSEGGKTDVDVKSPRQENTNDYILYKLDELEKRIEELERKN